MGVLMRRGQQEVPERFHPLLIIPESSKNPAKILMSLNRELKTIKIFPAEWSGTPFGVPGFHPLPVSEIGIEDKAAGLAAID